MYPMTLVYLERDRPREGSSPAFHRNIQLQTLASPPHTVEDLYRGIWKSQIVQMSWT